MGGIDEPLKGIDQDEDLRARRDQRFYRGSLVL